MHSIMYYSCCACVNYYDTAGTTSSYSRSPQQPGRHISTVLVQY